MEMTPATVRGLTLGNAFSNILLVFRKVSSDHGQIEGPQDAGIRFAFQQETETLCDQRIPGNIGPAQSNPIGFLQCDLMSRGCLVADSDFILIAGEVTYFDHAITKNPIKTGFRQWEQISVIRAILNLNGEGSRSC